MKRLLAASLLVALSPAAFAASAGFVDAFFIPKADIEIGAGEDDGDGFGLRGMFNVAPQVAVTGEYRTVSYDDSGIDYDQFRIGGMYLIQGQSGVGLEYLNAAIDDGGDADLTGFILNGRLAGDISPQISLYGQLGYLINGEIDDGTTTDTDGFELTLGGVFNINKQFGVLLDMRRSDLDADGTDLLFSDIAIGARINL